MARGAQDVLVYEPGLDRHDWEGEMEALEEQLGESPAEALPELDALVGRMLEETGYDLADPVVREGDEREVVSDFLAAREITQLAERGNEEIGPGDVAAAINGYRAVYDHLISTRAASDSDLHESDQEP